MDSVALRTYGLQLWAAFTLLTERGLLASLPTSSGVYVILLPQPEQRRAVVMDRYSRRIFGWSLGPNKNARLTLAALKRAVFHRRPRPGIVFHSDGGVEHAAYAFRHRLAAVGFVQSMNGRGRSRTTRTWSRSFTR